MARTASSDNQSPFSSPTANITNPPLHAPVPRSLRASVSSGAGNANASGGGSAHTHTHNPLHPHHSRPSSPASIHSSASAIFERDIELPAVASLSLNPSSSSHSLSHKPSRLMHPTHGSALDHTVPAVLDDAVEALTASEGQSRGFGGLEIEAPAPTSGSGIGIGMVRQSSSSLSAIGGPGGRSFSLSHGQGAVNSASRSSSPMSAGSANSNVVSPATSPPIMGQLANHINSQNASPLGANKPTDNVGPQTATTAPLNDTTTASSVPRPAMGTRMSTGPLLPGGWAFGRAGAGSGAGTAADTAAQEEPAATAPTSAGSAALPESAIALDEVSHSDSSLWSFQHAALRLETGRLCSR
jgi:hypothetical protein